MPISYQQAAQQAQNLIQRSNQRIHEGVARGSDQTAPQWLRALWAVLSQGGRDELLHPFANFPSQLDDGDAFASMSPLAGSASPQNPEQVLAWVPSQRLRQIQALLETVWTPGSAWPQPVDGQNATQQALQIRLWHAQVLHAIKRTGDPQAALRTLSEAPDANAPRVTLPILLVNERAKGEQQGCLAQLRLWLWHCPNEGNPGPGAPHASLHLLPTLAQACVPLTLGFANSLDTVAHVLRQQVSAAQAQDMALVWDLAPLKGSYHLLGGPSASAAFGLAGLWLQRQHLEPAWRQALARLTQSDLGAVYLSAELLADGRLHQVGGIHAKDVALALTRMAQGHLGGERPLYVAANQTLMSPDDTQLLRLSPHDTLLAVAQALNARPMTEAQTALYEALGQALATLPEPPGPADQACPNHLPPRLPTDHPTLGTALAALDNPAALSHRSSHPLHYALRCWAQRGRSISGLRSGLRDGQVHQRFVNLQLSAPSLGADDQTREESFDTLEQLLDAFERGSLRHECPSAVLIEGEPGAGKSWLMARHEQALAEQYIWHDLHPGEPLAQAPVLPLYLPLNLLEPESDPVQFYRQWLLAQYPDERLGLAQRLDPARRNQGSQPYRLRLLIDGLNEVKAERYPDKRAQEAVIELWKAFAPDLPMVLGIRPRREWTLADPVQRFSVRKAQLKTWTRAHIQTYLQRRWGEDSPQVSAFLKDLAPGSAHEALLGTPLFLNLQCELWEAGAQALLANRAHLLSAMLWLRLGQELGKAPVVKGQALGPLRAEGMLSPAEIATAQAFAQNPGQPPEFPRQGYLLKGLFAQAKAQWLAKPGGDTQTRGQVSQALPWVERSLLAAGLPEPALEPWFAAVQELGLARLERVRNHSEHQFRYEHQVFGEWLASAALFYSGAQQRRPGEQALPTHWAPEALAQLARELEPPPLAHSAEEELQVQRQRTAQAWADPRLDELLAEWLERGLSLPLAEVQDTLSEARSIPMGQGDNMLALYQHPDVGFVQPNAAGDHWAWCFAAFGGWLVRHGHIKAQGDAGHWFEDRSAWASACQSTAVWPVFREAAKQAMTARLGRVRCEELWAMGRLGLPPPGELDDIVPLALDALGNEALLAWLGWMQHAGPWALLSRSLVKARERLQALPDPAAQALWAASTQRLLAVVQDTGPTPKGRQEQAPAQAKWHVADPRQRLQAGELLGEQGEPGSPEGDHLRFERSGSGLRLREQHWVAVGGPGQRFRLGDPACGEDAAPWLWLGNGPGQGALPVFKIARLPVTVAEYRRFMDDGGYGQPGRAAPPWWQAAGPAAAQWLQQRQAQGAALQPSTWGDTGFSNPLQPVSGLTWYEAQAYCQWAGERVYADWLARLNASGSPQDPHWVLRLPTEWEWEAAMRGPHSAADDAPALAWPGHGPQANAADEPEPMLFNHSATGWKRPSPVGCWGGSQCASGLLDGVGNVWNWCANVYHANWAAAGNGLPSKASALLKEEQRALRGGSFNYTASQCRVGRRLRYAPDYFDFNGLRLVLAVGW